MGEVDPLRRYSLRSIVLPDKLPEQILHKKFSSSLVFRRLHSQVVDPPTSSFDRTLSRHIENPNFRLKLHARFLHSRTNSVSFLSLGWLTQANSDAMSQKRSNLGRPHRPKILFDRLHTAIEARLARPEQQSRPFSAPSLGLCPAFISSELLLE